MPSFNLYIGLYPEAVAGGITLADTLRSMANTIDARQVSMPDDNGGHGTYYMIGPVENRVGAYKLTDDPASPIISDGGQYAVEIALKHAAYEARQMARRVAARLKLEQAREKEALSLDAGRQASRAMARYEATEPVRTARRTKRKKARAAR